MPIATPQGTLDFKSVDKVTFVGASSNTVIDTTTGSLGVGVGVGGPTSNLHVVGDALITGNVSDLNVVSNVNMLHTSNTASIKLNSNVVAEFPRSKKFMKFPRVALTSAAQSSAGGYEGYIVNQSSVYGGPPNAWQSFGGNQHWLSSSNSFDGGDDVFNTVNGPWISIQLPTKIKLEYLEFYVGSGRPGQTVAGGSVYASNDGSNWISIGSLDNLGNYTDTSPAHVNFTHTTRYDRYLLHVTSVSLYTYAHIERLSLFGVPEYDPDAHGTDVVVKSVANVPNTDWLDIYIDGQDYPTMPSGPGSVLDKSTNNRHGTPSNVTFNSTWKAFEIESASTSNITVPFNSTGGAYVHTIALWFLMDTTTGGNRCIFTIRGSESGGRQIALIVNQDDTNIGFKYDFYSADVRYHDPSVVANKWMHVALTYSGGNNSVTSKEIYLNGVRLGVTAVNSNPLNLTGTENLLIGGDLNSGNVSFEGMVANFRMFNRVLSKDEIYQLYAYQKEYFGHGDLSMTLKAGRLGIGTSEPRAALDVRGDVHISGSLRKTRALMFRRNSGSYTYTTQNTFQTIVDYGPPWVAYSTNPLYNISHTGDYTDSNWHHLYLRIAIKNESTGEVVYFPHSTGWRYYMHTTYQRLDEHSYQGILSGLTIGNSYTTSYEIKPRGVSSYNWNSIYGDITGIVWD